MSASRTRQTEQAPVEVKALTDIDLMKASDEAIVGKIDDTVKAAIFDIADSAYNAYWGKGGIEDQRKALEENTDKLYAHKYLVMARYAVQIAGNNLPAAAHVFKACAKWAIGRLQAKHTDPNTGKVPTQQEVLPGSANYISYFAKGLAGNLNPDAVDPASKTPIYNVASKYMTAARALGEGTGAQGVGSKAGDAKAEVIKLAVVESNLTPEFAGVFKALGDNVHAFEKWPELQPEACKLMAQLNNTYAGMIADAQRSELERRETVIQKISAGNRPKAQAEPSDTPEAQAVAAQVATERAEAQTTANPRKAARLRGGSR